MTLPADAPKWPDEVLQAVEKQLAVYLGPLAKVIVKRAAVKAADLDQLYLIVAENLDKKEERAAFLARKSELRRSVPAHLPGPAAPLKTGTAYPKGDEPRTAVVPRPQPKVDPQPPKAVSHSAPPLRPDVRPVANPATRDASPVSKPIPPQPAAPPVTPPLRPEPRLSTPPVQPAPANAAPKASVRAVAPNLDKPAATDRQPRVEPPKAAPSVPPAIPQRREPARSGETLASWLIDDPVDFGKVSRIFIASVEAVVALSSKSPAIEPLSPQSIRFEGGKATIGSSQPGTSSETAGLVGNPRYAPPEMFSENSSSADPGVVASQTYALGMMFYEIVLGRKLFAKTFSDQHSDLDWLRWHADPAKKAPPLKSLLPDCPVALSDLLESMMAKLPEERPANLESVVSRLRSAAGRASQTVALGKGGTRSLSAEAPVAAMGEKGGNGTAALAIVLLILAAAGFVIWLNPGWYQQLVSYLRHLMQ